MSEVRTRTEQASTIKLSKQELDALRKGPRIRMVIEERETTKEVNIGSIFFPRYVTIPHHYIDQRAVEDPARSDLPMMFKLEALGLVRRIRWWEMGDGFTWRFEWRVTERGQKAIAGERIGSPSQEQKASEQNKNLPPEAVEP